jgi:HD-GYP domain-containing protein (c-di-GMP phosphodiesterase class II)
MTEPGGAPAPRPVDVRVELAVEGILAMLKAHEETAFQRARATGAWCRRLAAVLQLAPASADLAVNGGLLHDIGVISTPDAILFKTTPLTEAEWIVARRHADAGAAIVAELPALAAYAPIVRAHHERWDGRGYPRGLQAESIPLEARIVAVADAFHAMITDRPYRRAIAQRDALNILRNGRNTQWDARVVDAMLTLLDAPRTAAGRRYVAR